MRFLARPRAPGESINVYKVRALSFHNKTQKSHTFSLKDSKRGTARRPCVASPKSSAYNSLILSAVLVKVSSSALFPYRINTCQASITVFAEMQVSIH